MAMLALISLAAPTPSIQLEREVTFGGTPLWHVIGKTPKDKLLSITVMLTPRPAALARLEQAFWAVSDPDDALYGQHWSQAEVTTLVGNPQGCDEVASWLLRAGASVKPRVHRDGVEAEIRVASAEVLFNTTFFDYEHQTRGVVLSRIGATGYRVPARLAQTILLIEGIGRLPALRVAHVTHPTPILRGTRDVDGHDDDNDSGVWPRSCGLQLLCSTTPATLRAAYQLPPAPANASEAHGSTLAVAEFQGERWDQPDFDEFSKACHVEPPVKVDHSIGDGGESMHCRIPMAGSSDCGEALLDIEYAKALGGAIPLTNVFAKEYNILKWAQTVSALNDTAIPRVHSVSYGMDETMQASQQSLAYMNTANTAFMQLGVRGISLLVASGDSGVCGIKGCDTYDPGVNFSYSPVFPASSPYVTTVGATDFEHRSRVGPEEAWDNSGGGFSNTFPAPRYQAAAIAAYKRTANASLPNPVWWNATGRGYPDVSALGGDRNSYCIAGGTLFAGTWGTSASAPVVATIFARLNALRLAAGGKPLGFLNPWVYKHADAFNDVTKGVNNHHNKKYGGFEATVGWDPATGVGTPNWPKLVAAL